MCKGEIVRYEQFPPFPTVFSKDLYCRHVKTKACLGKGERKYRKKTKSEFVVGKGKTYRSQVSSFPAKFSVADSQVKVVMTNTFSVKV